MTIRDWAIHYNRGRPHSALGPGLPEPVSEQVPSNEHDTVCLLGTGL